ncbi:SDR family oxidoreductase [Rickettsiales endosymbiont of Trichoplax sp. H2]|uniref:SDR family oxidoreductase n=1 Tax=Rickettsiales endosymbiont of Trichoplax sp. H2 TaxID=2021221 RepID=UPI0012B34501|nr:SDR family oxidoreductase [Rickettsiales endosymbiont of Trichoplax sp. H2]MSO13989.1 3-oxoacyl-[acyl-carrier-protein] reductase, chloroplastic [Rickettsiales endosymbiont of Trichoplax sp. H2]
MSYALITGSAKRIGRNIAIFLAKEGWDIIIHYNKSTNEAQNLHKIIFGLNKECLLYQADFSKNENLDPTIQKLPIGLIVNNASIFNNDSLKNITKDNLINNLNTNFITPTLITKKILDHSTYEGQINIINILDSIIYKLPKNFSSYYFSKKSFANYTRLSAKLYAPNARINGISLGQILKNDNQSEKNFKKSFYNNPLGYSGTIDEICNTIDFILKNRSITGQIISLDGGSHLDNVNYP